MKHELFMARCLELAGSGGGHVHPNPLVGAVVVYNGQVIGEGFHRKFGGPHAEVNAINSVSDKSLLPESTLYVSLEPCSHFGKTPPCSDLIIRSGIRKVVVAVSDPNPKVGGSGISKLKKSGVEVLSGVMEQESRFQNRRFFSFMERSRPYVILKWAESADGFLGFSDKKILISNTVSRTLVHKWRSEEHAIMVGTNTALIDNPRLDARMWGPPDPLRVVLDMDLRLNMGLHLYRKNGTLIVLNGVRSGQDGNIIYRKVSAKANLAASVLKALHDEGIVSVLIEGGRKLLDSFISTGLWDECRVFRSSTPIRGDIKAPDLPHRPLMVDDINGDTLLTFQNDQSF